MCKVLNNHNSNNGVYIGRGSFWGNPFRVGVDGTRAQVIAQYIAFYKNNVEFITRSRNELKGKNLVCFCAPLACHGDWLIQIANS